MNNSPDFGFNHEQFNQELVPYAQFFNADAQKYGIAVTANNAELAQFELNDNWQPIEHQFKDGANEILLFTNQPRLLILNRSKPMMSNDAETIPYNKAQSELGGYKPFSYVVVWFLDRDNQPISQLPLRLRCSGYSGYTFLKNYDYHDNSNSFCKQFLATYKSLTSDRAVEKNDLFYAHAVYQPQLVRAKVTSSVNGQSNWAVLTQSFVEPDPTNFASTIVKNGSPLSDRIKQLIQTTKPWLKTEEVDSEAQNTVDNATGLPKPN